MIRHQLNKCHTENRGLKRKIKNLRFVAFLSWFGMAFVMSVHKGDFIPLIVLFSIVYFIGHKKGAI